MAKVKLPIYLRIGDGTERRVGTLKLSSDLAGAEVLIEVGKALEELAAHFRRLPTGADERWSRERATD